MSVLESRCSGNDIGQRPKCFACGCIRERDHSRLVERCCLANTLVLGNVAGDERTRSAIEIANTPSDHTNDRHEETGGGGLVVVQLWHHPHGPMIVRMSHGSETCGQLARDCRSSGLRSAPGHDECDRLRGRAHRWRWGWPAFGTSGPMYVPLHPMSVDDEEQDVGDRSGGGGAPAV